MATRIISRSVSWPIKSNFNKLGLIVPFWRMGEEVQMATAADSVRQSSNKISIVGVGNVGMACAFSLLTLNVTDEIALTDSAVEKLRGELLDLQHGTAYTPGVKITGEGDFAVTKDSRICVITSGAKFNPGQNITDLISQNIKNLQSIIPKILKYSPETIILIVSNPVDILTYAAWKISGRPLNSIIGTGTSLDTARLKYLISQRIGINIQSVHLWIIGEHGESSVPIWSNLQIGGVSIQNADHPLGMQNYERLNELHTTIINSSYEITKLKGYTSWAIGLNVADICKSILRNTRHLHAVSTLVKGFHGVEAEVFLSLPCVLIGDGISHVIPLVLNDKEKNDFLKASIKLYQIQSTLKL